MTCIAAVVGPDGTIYMGGDSAVMSDDSTVFIRSEVEPKVWIKEGILFGACGSPRLSQIIRWQMQVPRYHTTTPPFEYLTGPLASAMREALRDNGALVINENRGAEEMDGSLLLGFCGKLYEIYSDFGVGEMENDYGAAGCAGPLAIGSLATTSITNASTATKASQFCLTPELRIDIALYVALRHSAGVRGPMETIKLDPPTVERQ